MYAAMTLLLHFAALIVPDEAQDIRKYIKDVILQNHMYWNNQNGNGTVLELTNEESHHHENLNELPHEVKNDGPEEPILFKAAPPGEYAVVNQNRTIIYYPPPYSPAPQPYPNPTEPTPYPPPTHPPYPVPPVTVPYPPPIHPTSSTVNHLPTVTPIYPTTQYPRHPTQNPWYPATYPWYPTGNLRCPTPNPWCSNGYPWYSNGYPWYSNGYSWYQNRYK